MIRNLAVLLVLFLTTSAVASESATLMRLKQWTHANGNSAMLELVDCKGDWVKFRKADGKIWTMPIENLAPDDQQIIIDTFKNSDFRVSLPGPQDLDSVQASFEQLKTDEPDLYNRLNEIAEYPMDDYKIQLNDDGVYYLQFMLKQGASEDSEAEAMIGNALNAANFGDPIKFELRQIPQEDETDNVMAETESTDQSNFDPPSPENNELEMKDDSIDMSLSPGVVEMPMETEIQLSQSNSSCGCTSAPYISDVVYYTPCCNDSGCCGTHSNCGSCSNDCCQSDCYQNNCCYDHDWCSKRTCRRPRFGLLRRLFRFCR